MQLSLHCPQYAGHNNNRYQQQWLGAHCLSVVVQGSWDFLPQGIVSNILELQSLWAFCHLTAISSVMLRLDNTKAVAYIRRWGNLQPVPAAEDITDYDLGAEELGQHIGSIYIQNL